MNRGAFLVDSSGAPAPEGGPARPSSAFRRYWRLILGGSGALLLVIVLAVALSGGSSASDSASTLDDGALADAIDLDSMLDTLQTLQDIADDNGGTREVGAGFNASIDWMQEQAEAVSSDVDVWTQTFVVTAWEVVGTPALAATAPAEEAWAYEEDFGLLTYSGGGSLTAPAFAAANYGCDAADYDNATAAGAVALISRGDCTFFEKTEAAVAAGAVAALIYNEGDSDDRLDLFSGTLGEPVDVVVLAASYALGQDLVALADDGLELFVNASVDLAEETTSNLLAQPASLGSADSVIVVGAHLDSVEAGPGINDNGSGSAANLELLRRVVEVLWASSAAEAEVHNAIRFAWWGAEELGLLGSTAYVEALSADELAQIALDLNFDMLASPNGARFVYDGASSDDASAYIQGVFEAALDGMGLAHEPTEFDGRSDYGPFLDAGVPAGGLFSGAEDIKDEAMREEFGGIANAAYDPCYHDACDNIDNVDADLYDELVRAAAYALQELATTEDLAEVMGDGPGRRRLRSGTSVGASRGRHARR